MRGPANAPPTTQAAPPEEVSRYCTFCKASFRMEILRCPRDGAPVEVMPQDPLLGEILGERYRIVSALGSGGMGRVYLADVLADGGRVAVKVLHGDLAADEKMVARFEREARAISRLSSPHIVAIVDFGTTSQGLLYLVMELLSGKPLHEAIAKDGPFSVQKSMHICRQLGEALDHAHDRGLIHRDLKPANVIVSEKNRDPNFATILDFGLARMTEVNDPKDAELLTSMGVIRGTPEFMSPEQARGLELDRRSDLYALGVLLFLMLTQRFPFPRPKSRLDVLTMHVMTPPYPVSKFVQVPEAIERIVAKLLAKEPEDRYQDGKQLVAAIDAIGDKRAGRDSEEEEQEPTRIFSMNSMATPIVAPATTETPLPNARRKILFAAVIGGVSALALGLVFWLTRPEPNTSLPSASAPASEPFLSAPQVPAGEMLKVLQPGEPPPSSQSAPVLAPNLPVGPVTPKPNQNDPKGNEPTPKPKGNEPSKAPEGKAAYESAKSSAESALKKRGLSAFDLAEVSSSLAEDLRKAKQLADADNFTDAAARLSGFSSKVEALTLNVAQLVLPKLKRIRTRIDELAGAGIDVTEYNNDRKALEERAVVFRSSGGSQNELENLNRDTNTLLTKLTKLK